MTFSIHVSGYLPLVYSVVGVVCTMLALLVAAILYLIRAKQSNGKETRSSQPPSPSFSGIRAWTLFTVVLLQLLLKGEDGAELTVLFAGCRETSACCHHMPMPGRSRAECALYSSYLKHLTPPCSSCPLPGIDVQ